MPCLTVFLILISGQWDFLLDGKANLCGGSYATQGYGQYLNEKRRLTDANRLNYADFGFVSFYFHTVAELDMF